MGINFNANFQPQINPLLANQNQSAGIGSQFVDITMTPDGSIFTPDNLDIASQQAQIVQQPELQQVQIPLDQFLTDMNLQNLTQQNIAQADLNPLPNEVLQLIDNQAVPTTNITYNPTEDGSVITDHFTRDNPPQLLAQTTQMGDAISTVTYNQDGIPTKSSLVENGTQTINMFDETGQNIVQETVIENNSTTITNFDETGKSTGSTNIKGAITTQFDANGKMTSKTVDKGSGGIYETTYSQDAQGNTIETTKGPLGDVTTTTQNAEGNALSQTVTTADGKTHTARYDGNGNTYITVQNGESMAKIAKQFGCSVEDLKSMNKTHGASGQEYFQAGQEIVVPSEIPADDARITNRDSKEVAQQKYKTAMDAKAAAATPQETTQETEVADDSRIQLQQQAAKEGRDIARALRNDMKSLGTSSTIYENAKQINSNNVLETINAYEAQSGESLINALNGEMADTTEIATRISSSLIERATSAGVDPQTIGKFEIAFKNSRTGTLDKEAMNTAVKTFAGEIAAKEIGATGDINTQDAMGIVSNAWSNNVDAASDAFAEARELDSNIGKAADTVLGFFGCTTIDDMTKKLGVDKESAAKLMNATQSNDVDGFKSAYKEIFGRDFDPKLVASYDQASTQYMEAKQYKTLSDSVGQMLLEYRSAAAKEDNPNSAQMTQKMQSAIAFYSEQSVSDVTGNIQNRLQKQLGLTNEQFSELLSNNGNNVETLLTNLQGAYNQLQSDATGGVPLNQFEQQISSMESAIFGGNDRMAEVAKFNRNQQVTDVAANIVVDVAVTTALGIVPGGQAFAGAKMAATGARFAKMATKAPKMVKLYNNMSRVYNGSKTLKTVGNAATKVSRTVTSDVSRDQMLSFIHGSDSDSIQVFKNSATNTSIKLGVNYLAKGLHINSKVLESALASAVQVGVGTKSPEEAFFSTVLSSTNLTAAQQKQLASTLSLNLSNLGFSA